MNVAKNKCTEKVIGKVKNLKIKGQDFPTQITVEYQVSGTKYEVTESLKMKSEKIKLGFLTIGQKRVAAMGDTRVGSDAWVNYNPNAPEESFITNNIGKANV